MRYVLSILMALIRLALFLGMTGGFVDLVRDMQKEAALAHKQGIVSIKQLNESLIGK